MSTPAEITKPVDAAMVQSQSNSPSIHLEDVDSPSIICVSGRSSPPPRTTPMTIVSLMQQPPQFNNNNPSNAPGTYYFATGATIQNGVPHLVLVRRQRRYRGPKSSPPPTPSGLRLAKDLSYAVMNRLRLLRQRGEQRGKDAQHEEYERGEGEDGYVLPMDHSTRPLKRRRLAKA